MKLRFLPIVFILSLLLSGCGNRPEAETSPAPADQEVSVAAEPAVEESAAPAEEVPAVSDSRPEPEEAPIAVVADAQENKGALIYEIDPNAEITDIPEQPVPLAESYLDLSDGVSKREAEAIAIHHAGFGINEVSFLYAKLVEDDGPIHYEVNFHGDNTVYEIMVDVNTGEILSE